MSSTGIDYVLSIMRSFLLLIVMCLFGVSVSAQHNSESIPSNSPAPVGEWRSLSSYNYVQDLASDSEDRIWGATTGGIFVWNSKTSVFDALLTPLEGLSRLDPTVIAYLSNQDLMIVGYPDGTLDVIDPTSFKIRTLNDIKRTSLFTDKRINAIETTQDGVFVGTGFGVVKYDLNIQYVLQTFSSLGVFTSGSAVRDMVIDTEKKDLWVATDQGLALASLSDDLSLASTWQNVTSDLFGGASVQELAFFQDKIYLTTSDGNFEKTRSTTTTLQDGWLKNQTFGSVLITDYHLDQQANRLYAVYRNTLFYLDENLRRRSYTIPELGNVVVANKGLWVGSFQSGLVYLDEVSETTQRIEVNGPAMNSVSDIRFTESGFITATTRFSNRTFLFDDLKGFSIVENGQWANYNMTNRKELKDAYFTLTYRSLLGQRYAYFGSWGSGIARFNLETEAIDIFNAENTSIRGFSASDYIVISGLEKDSNGDIWAVSRYASKPLIYHVEGSQEWTPLASSSALSSADRYMRMFIDSNDFKWITLESTSEAGRGLMVLDTGQDPLSTSDDRAVVLNTGISLGNLPDATVTAIVEDRNGEVWIGTERGIARFIFPDLILDGGSAERQAQWLIADEPGDISPFLLRDLSVTDIVVNGANQKWVGSSSNGLWLLNEKGSRVLAHYTSENSPLLSNSITDLSYHSITGELTITTSLGVIILTDVSIQGEEEMEALDAYPNPFVYDRHQNVIIEGLSERSTLFVVTVDGVRIRRLDVSGGRVEWDGLDRNGDKLATGVYLLIATDQNGGQRGVGKMVIIR